MGVCREHADIDRGMTGRKTNEISPGIAGGPNDTYSYLFGNHGQSFASPAIL
jgi:hypothetical protein